MSRCMGSRYAAMLAMLISALALCLLSGCAVPIIAEALDPGRVKKVHELENKPTLVFVQIHPGAQGVFHTPRFRDFIAAKVAHDLLQAKVIDAAIDQVDLYEVETRVGQEAYTKMSVTQIAREVRAEQVIVVDVLEARLQQVPGMYEPTVVSAVSVLDAVRARRVFPPIDPLFEEERRTSPGQTVTTTAPRRGYDQLTPQEDMVLRRDVAVLVGQDVGRLFYNWNRNY